MRVSCVRHGVTELNARGVFSSMGREGLTERQRRDLAAVEFDASDFDAVYCSPAKRCRETAATLGVHDLILEPRLAEQDFGVFDGMTADQCRRTYASEFEAVRLLDADFVIPGGESRAQHLDRVLAWLRDVVHHQHVLAATHGGTIDFLYRLGAGEPLHGVQRPSPVRTPRGPCSKSPGQRSRSSSTAYPSFRDRRLTARAARRDARPGYRASTERRREWTRNSNGIARRHSGERGALQAAPRCSLPSHSSWQRSACSRPSARRDAASRRSRRRRSAPTADPSYFPPRGPTWSPWRHPSRSSVATFSTII